VARSRAAGVMLAGRGPGAATRHTRCARPMSRAWKYH
jgi:hypothetical protein